MGHGNIGLSGYVSCIISSTHPVSIIFRNRMYIDKSAPQIAQTSLNETSCRQGSITEKTGSLNASMLTRKCRSNLAEETTLPSLTSHSVKIPSQGLSNCSTISFLTDLFP